MFALGCQPHLEIDQSYAGLHQRHQLLLRGIVHLTRRLAECLGKPGDHLRIDRIVLCHPSGRMREASHPFGIDNPHLDAGLAQHLGPVMLIATARFHDSLAHLVFAKPGNQLAMSLCTTRPSLMQCQCANAHVHLVLRHIDTGDNGIILCHRPLPSLLVRARSPCNCSG